MKKFVFAGLFILIWATCIVALLTVENHLSESDLKRLREVFQDGISSNDLQSMYYSSLNLEPLNTGKEAFCDRLRIAHKDSKLNDSEKDFYVIGAHKNAQCTNKLPEGFISKVSADIKRDAATTQEIYFHLASHKLLELPLEKVTIENILKNVQDILKRDDTLVNLGYAFNLAVELGPAAAFIADRVEDAIVQADEVDGKMLQFEGGLSITALVVNGAFRINKAYGKPSPLNAEQAVKFATYFLSRRSVQTAKGAHILIEALNTLGQADAMTAPICVQVIGSAQLEASSPVLNIMVVDLIGKPLSPPPQIIYAKINMKKANSVLAEKVQFTSRSSDKSVFAADLAIFKPTRGGYVAEINVDSLYTQTLQFKVLGRVKVHSLEVGVGDTDASSTLKKRSVTYPNTLSETLYADSTQKLVLKAVLLDEDTTEVITVHQAFVRLYNKQSEEEIIFIAEQDSSKTYKFDIDVGARGADFGYKSGVYEMELIIGDASISNSFRWHVSNVQLKFSQEPKVSKKGKTHTVLPEIHHQFRTPEKRPPRIVSDIFTGLCWFPLVLLMITWKKMGINLSKFTLSPTTLGFHLGFGSILALYIFFWLKLNMFQTLKILIPLAILTFLCGNRMLRRMYAQRVGKNPT